MVEYSQEFQARAADEIALLPEGSVVDDRSITTHPLDRAYALLQADGTLGAVVTEATIRNNEGLILIPVD